MESIKIYFYGFIIMVAFVGVAVLIILIFWISKFKRTWFKSKKRESVPKEKKGKKEEQKTERLESSDQYDDGEQEVEMKVSEKKAGKYRELK